jgi:hypothetical protein
MYSEGFDVKCLLLIVSVLMLSGLSSCKTIKPYEKEYLLSPLMDEATFSPIGFDYSSRVVAKVEKLSQGSASSAGGSSCPTCGG